MISLIVSSYNPAFFKSFQSSVANTIGVEYEIIKIDNAGIMGICEAYNKGASMAKFPYLCFLHEDITFETIGWGNVLINLLLEQSTGLIGVAGGVFKSKTIGPAWYNFLKNGNRINILQLTPLGFKHLNENPNNEKQAQVVSLDGVFMSCRSEVWNEFKFDEKTLKNFHFYDLDFSLSINQKYKVYVTYGILIKHFSEGKNDKEWYNQAIIIHHKWEKKLPVSIYNLSAKQYKEVEYASAEFNFDLIQKLKLGWNETMTALIKLICLRPFIKKNFFFIKQALRNVR